MTTMNSQHPIQRHSHHERQPALGPRHDHNTHSEWASGDRAVWWIPQLRFASEQSTDEKSSAITAEHEVALSKDDGIQTGDPS